MRSLKAAGAALAALALLLPSRPADATQVPGSPHRAQAFTSNATQTDALTYSVTENDTVKVLDIVVLAKQQSGANAAAFRGLVTIMRTSGGNISIVGTIAVLGANKTAGAATWTVAAAVSGTDLILRVTGGVGQDIDWLVKLDGEQFP